MSQFFRELARKIIFSDTFVESMTDMMAIEIEKQLQGVAAGDRLYIPKTTSNDDKAARNRIIRSQFVGNNHEALAKTYHMTVRQVRRIVRPVSDIAA